MWNVAGRFAPPAEADEREHVARLRRLPRTTRRRARPPESCRARRSFTCLNLPVYGSAPRSSCGAAKPGACALPCAALFPPSAPRIPTSTASASRASAPLDAEAPAGGGGDAGDATGMSIIGAARAGDGLPIDPSSPRARVPVPPSLVAAGAAAAIGAGRAYPWERALACPAPTAPPPLPRLEKPIPPEALAAHLRGVFCAAERVALVGRRGRAVVRGSPRARSPSRRPCGRSPRFASARRPWSTVSTSFARRSM